MQCERKAALELHDLKRKIEESKIETQTFI